MFAPNPIVEADFTLLKRQLPGSGTRGARRYRCDLATLCRIVAAQGDSGDIAWVHDVSKTGIGLILAHAAEASTNLTLRMRKTDQNGVITKDVTVVHCTPEVNGSWRIGCVFAQELTDDEIDCCI